MASEAPPFWWEKSDWRAWMLWPVSAVYGAVARYRLDNAPREEVPLPVLCIGNFTVGGAGKTPVAIAFAETARALGRTPGFLSRGHGGSLTHPHLVDPQKDSARLVGDEPLLLAAHGPVAVSADREGAAKLLQEAGCDFIIMDDGFQSARIHIDFALLVVDGVSGLGNGHVIPGGPMRAPLADQLRHGDAVLVMGEGDAGDYVVRKAARAGKPVHRARVEVVNGDAFCKKRVFAFAGIGDPSKFYASLRGAGADIAATRNFGDHHPYSDDELEELVSAAKTARAKLVTTAKDAVRLSGGSSLARSVAGRVLVLNIRARFETSATGDRIVTETLNSFRLRR